MISCKDPAIYRINDIVKSLYGGLPTHYSIDEKDCSIHFQVMNIKYRTIYHWNITDAELILDDLALEFWMIENCREVCI